MSKLNDRTLKILKKYRLDTDMSVFGNENKLYDVVKVMDDMVGNQVSKYVAAVTVINSLETSQKMCNKSKDVSVFKEHTITDSIPRIQNDIYIYDPLSMKKIMTFKAGDNILPIGYILSSDGILCYVNFDINRKTFFCSSDEKGQNNLTGNNVPIATYGITLFLCFSTKKLSSNITNYTISYLISDTNPEYAIFNASSLMPITLPEELGLLKDELWCNVPSTSNSYTFPKINTKLNITEV